MELCSLLRKLDTIVCDREIEVLHVRGIDTHRSERYAPDRKGNGNRGSGGSKLYMVESNRCCEGIARVNGETLEGLYPSSIGSTAIIHMGVLEPCSAVIWLALLQNTL
jgi:hypothetical protein